MRAELSGLVLQVESAFLGQCPVLVRRPPVSRDWVLGFGLAPTPRFAPGSEGAMEMTFDYLLAAAVTVGLLGYLGYALVRPERF